MAAPRLSTAAWFYLFGDRARLDPRGQHLPDTTLLLATSLHRLSATGHVSLELGARRSGLLWTKKVPSVLVTLTGRHDFNRGVDGRLLNQVVGKPRHGHDLFWRASGKSDNFGDVFVEMTQDEVVAAGLARRVETPREGRHGVVRAIKWDRRRLEEIEDDFAPMCEDWLEFCSAQPEVVEAMVCDVHHAALGKSWSGYSA